MKRKLKIIIITNFIIIIISTISVASYKVVIKGNAKADLKKPVFVLDNSDYIQGQMSSRKNTFYENTFNVLNYIENNTNEVDLEYVIKIIPSTLNFPVKYRIIDLKENQELELDSNLESEKISIRY